MSLERYSKIVEAKRKRHFIKRVMWLDLEERVRETLSPLLSRPEAEAFGHPHLHTLHSLRINKRDINQLTRLNLLNAIYIKCNACPPDIYKSFGTDKDGWVIEKEAGLWYSQSVSGGVYVYISPNSSDLLNYDFTQLCIAHYSSPHEISESKIRCHFNSFLKLYSLTTYVNEPSRGTAAQIFWLRVKDRQHRLKASSQAYAIIQGLLLPAVIGVASIIVTLITSSK